MFKTTVSAVFLSAACFTCSAMAVPIFQYSFPASFDGTGTTVTDLSPAGNDATTSGAALSPTVPPGADPGTQSLDSSDGGIATVDAALLDNQTVAAGLGFRFDTSFNWNGQTNSFDILKIFDYAGTESLQILVDEATGDGTLVVNFNDTATGIAAAVEPDTWYDVSLIFTPTGGVDGDGNLPGNAELVLNGASTSLPVVKEVFGDSLNRPIGIGGFSISPGIIQFPGLIHDPELRLLIPEPSALGLLAVGAAAFGLRRRLT